MKLVINTIICILLNISVLQKLSSQNIFSEISSLSSLGLINETDEIVKLLEQTTFYFNGKPIKSQDLKNKNNTFVHSVILQSLFKFDFNFDGISELIYYGFNGSTTQLEILAKKGDEFKTIYKDDKASLLEFQIDSIKRNTIIKYVHQSGAGSDIGIFHELSISDKLEIDKDKAYFYSYTELPVHTEFIKRFVVLNEQYNLRLNPEITDNIIAVFTKNDEGTALASKKDSTGRVWWFVKMDNNIDKPKENFSYIKSEFLNSETAAQNQWFGWISSRYVNVIK